jgi:tyrosinase
MKVELFVNNSASPRTRYIGWAPSACSIRLSDTSGTLGPVTVELRNKPPAAGGRFVFRRTLASPSAASLNVILPFNGAPVSFFILGQFPRASLKDGDAVIQVRRGMTVLLEVPLMVRIRKNAQLLTAPEITRFVAAFAAFNNQGLGRFVDFRNMHVSVSSPEAHSAPGFLPWHRAYLLDLERELQAIDPSVALPYWRFDQPAPRIFTPGFLGVSNSNGTVQFSSTNPLQFWRTDGVTGINRRPFFNTANSGASVISESQTFALGTQYAQFSALEGNPHGSAHVSFGGSISSIPTAARDPLFFLLHANVDRLWAKWQRRNLRFNAAQAASFAPTGANRIGHNLNDTMWPWNQITTPPRPGIAPGGPLANSPVAAAPGASPRVRDLVDYQGSVAPAARVGFDYDDVQFA